MEVEEAVGLVSAVEVAEGVVEAEEEDAEAEVEEVVAAEEVDLKEVKLL